jgi:hypothetical protein
MRDFRLPLWSRWELYSSRLLHSEQWQFITDVSEQPIGDILRVQESRNPENWTDRLSRNVGKKLPLLAVYYPRRTQFSAVILSARKYNHANNATFSYSSYKWFSTKLYTSQNLVKWRIWDGTTYSSTGENKHIMTLKTKYVQEVIFLLWTNAQHFGERLV